MPYKFLNFFRKNRGSIKKTKKNTLYSIVAIFIITFSSLVRIWEPLQV